MSKYTLKKYVNLFDRDNGPPQKYETYFVAYKKVPMNYRGGNRLLDISRQDLVDLLAEFDKGDIEVKEFETVKTIEQLGAEYRKSRQS